MKKQIIALSSCMALLFTACTTAPVTPSLPNDISSLPSAPAHVAATTTDQQIAEDVAKVYSEVLEPVADTEDSWLKRDQEQQLLDAIAQSGVVAAGYHTQNRNTQQLIELVATAKAGGSGEAVVCWNLRKDRLVVSRFTVDAGKVTVTDRWLAPSTKTYDPSDDTMPLELFELRDGYLVYAESQEELDNNSAGWGFRIEPLEDELIDLCDRYIDPVWNSSYWLMTEWSPTDTSALNWDYLYEALLVGRTGMFYEDLPGMPATSASPFALPGAEVETTLAAAFPVTVEQLRALPEYRAADKTYQFMGFRGGGYSGNQEVTAVKENADGSLTLTVSVASVDFGNGAEPYCELTLLPDSSGGCKYLSNRIIYTKKPNKP